MTNKPNELVAAYRSADYDIDPVYLNRWSPRSFSDRPVDDETLLGLFEAARWAPSANNEQPWRFIVARTTEQRTRFYPFINEGNRIWCEKAPVLVLLVSHRIGSRGGENRKHAFDAGTAWGYFALEAARKGLISHAMGGFDAAKAREALGIPDDFEPQAVIAVGYQGPKEALPPAQQEREQPSARRPLSETLYEGSFGDGFQS